MRWALVGGTVWTGDGQVIPDGVVVVEGDRILSVGQDPVPPGTREVRVRRRYVLPGLVDAHVHAGLVEEGTGWEGRDGNELTDPVTPHVRAMDGIHPQDPGLGDALSGGVTAAYVTPGSGNVLGGQGAAVHTWGRTVEEMVLRAPAGMKAALGENPKRVYRERHRMPSTRPGIAAILREAFARAQEYMSRLERAQEAGERPPERDLRWEALIPVLRREIPLRVHAHRADDILTALRVAGEFGVRLTIEHATEGYLVAQELAQAAVPCQVGPALSGRSKVELRGKRYDNPVRLWEAGVAVSLITDHPVQPVETLAWAAGIAMREGMPEQEALKAITLHPARVLGVDDRVGTLAPGKLADVVVWEGHPFEIRSRVQSAYVAGRAVYEA